MLGIKKGTFVIIFLLRKHLLPWMSPSLTMNPFIHNQQPALAMYHHPLLIQYQLFQPHLLLMICPFLFFHTPADPPLPSPDSINPPITAINKLADPTVVYVRRNKESSIAPISPSSPTPDSSKDPSTSSVLTSTFTDYAVPKDHMEAMHDVHWKHAMEEEIKALRRNQTWTLVDLPASKRVVGCRWVYTVKLKADGSLDRFKARLMAKGYSKLKA